MKKLLLLSALFLAALIPTFAIAIATSSDQLIALGMQPAVASFIKSKLIYTDTSGNLVLPVASSKKLSLTVAGTEKASLSSAGLLTTTGGQTVSTGDETITAGNLIFGAASAKVIPGATSLLFRNNADSSTNLSITDAGVVTSRAAVVSTGLNFGSSSETVAGAGTTQGTAAALSASARVHRVTGANGTVGWILPVSVAGDFHVLLNTTAGVANVYPSTGGTINGASANAVFAALTGIKPIICVSTTTIDWICA